MAVPDLALADLALPTACNPVDNMGDGTPCSAGCGGNTTGVNFGGSCKCYAKCTQNVECACDRLCDPLTRNDASAGAACLPANQPGERCGSDPSTGVLFGYGFCSQLTACINADPTQMQRYCNYKCVAQSDCPAETTCQQYFDGQGNVLGMACGYDSNASGNKDLGQACTPPTDKCKTGQLCDGVCRTQCDGPNGTCVTGSCTRLDDAASGKVIGYVCK